MLISKSEHYHAALGHSFPGYGLIERARALGIPNATHNNTRGHLTRRLEEELLAAANGGGSGGLDCVLNLETGSLALEAALKLVLARFHPHAAGADAPPYGGRVPVILVIGDDDGGLTANYHGTTVLTQAMRGSGPRSVPAWNGPVCSAFVPSVRTAVQTSSALFGRRMWASVGSRRCSTRS